MPRIARVRFPSPIPALDKEFDYLVPESMPDLQFGQLVRVPFGKDQALKTAIVVGASSDTDFAGPLAEVIEIETSFPLLTGEQLELVESVSRRFLGSTGELLAQVLPKRMIRVEKQWIAPDPEQAVVQETEPKRIYLQPSIVREGNYPSWVIDFLGISQKYLSQNKSVLISLPDYRDLDLLKTAATAAGVVFTDIHSGNTASENYLGYLKAMSTVGMYVGLRSTVFLPARNLGGLLVLDDGDESHIEPTSPYWNTRDVALLRQAQDSCDLIFCSLSPSAEITRLIDIGYLVHVTSSIEHPAMSITASTNRLDDGIYGAVAKTLSDNKPVLIQIANLGFATALACARCSEIRTCTCGARIWIDTQKQYRCRSCKAKGALPNCSCGEQKVRVLRTGSSAIVEWLRNAFKDANVIHSSAEERITQITSGPNLVISTPGAEPEVPGGYGYVVIADAYSMVGAPRLRALEKSLLYWANALEKLSKDGVGVLVGLTGELAEQMRGLKFFQAVDQDYRERLELGLPPARRITSISCTNSPDLESLKTELISKLAHQITPIQTSDSDSIVFSFSYAGAETVLRELRQVVTAITNKSKNRLPGQRLFRVRIDDANVL